LAANAAPQPSNQSGSAPAQSPTWLKVPGVLLSFGVAIIAYFLGRSVPLVGGPVFGILLGLAITTVRRPGPGFKPGVQFSGKLLLQAAIVLMGFGLSLSQVVQTGSESLVVMLSTLATALVGAFVLGKLLGVSSNLTALVGAGTGICGASAIAAVAPVVQAEEREVAYAISTVFAFNIVAVFLFPFLGHVLGFSQKAFGLWAGTAINDTSSVVAAAYSFGPEAGAYATVVKLARASMIVPISLGIAAWRSYRSGISSAVKWTKIVPWFVLYFLLAALIRSSGLLPALAVKWLPEAGKFLIIVALSAVGLNADLKSIARTGWRPLALGALLWVVVAATSVIMQRLVGQV
jgi:uncharacterized integral membrane protein (TIGR00698 family)